MFSGRSEPLGLGSSRTDVLVDHRARDSIDKAPVGPHTNTLGFAAGGKASRMEVALSTCPVTPVQPGGASRVGQIDADVVVQLCETIVLENTSANDRTE